jgi:phosphoribosylaminoimidazole-succinocarboxamide synthase
LSRPGLDAGVHAQAITSTELPFKLWRRGKVRDVYEVPGDGSGAPPRLLMVATDRISAFDVVLEPGIPLKGAILTQLSNFWFDEMRSVVPNHLIATKPAEFPAELREHAKAMQGRCVLVEKLTPIPVECVVRGHLAGSGWKEYRKSGTVCGMPVPRGLRESERLPESMFTPATKEESGHDINISFEQCARIVGRDLATRLAATSLRIYEKARQHADRRGIILADTKLEFGLRPDGTLVLMDEVLTPDSSRFWPKEGFVVGATPPSFDKQFVRDWLESSGWNKEPPAPRLPADVVEGTAARYREAYEKLTGTPFHA